MADWWEAYPEATAAPAAAAPSPVAPAASGATGVEPAALKAPAAAAGTATPAPSTPSLSSPTQAPSASPIPAPAAAAAPASAPAGTGAPAAGSNWWDAYPEEPSSAPAFPAAPAEQPSVLQELGRQVGLTARAAVKGAIALPGVVSDAVTGPINAGLDALAGEGNGFRFQKVGSAADNLMTAAGVPEPKNATERVVQDVASGLAGTGATVAAGQLAAKAAGPITRALGKMASDAAGMQAVSSAASTGAAGITRESGGDATAQTIAGLAGALAPAGVQYAAQAAPRAALRGGEAGRQQVENNIKLFEEAAGTTPTMAQATGSRALQTAETGLTNVVGGSGVMMRKGQQQAQALADSVQNLTTALAPNASGVDAGEAIAKGVAAFRDNVKTTQERLYGTLDKHIAPNAPITVSNTRAALQDLNAGIPGADGLSAWFRNAKISGIEKSLVSDLEAAAAAQAPAGSRSGIFNAAPPDIAAASLPYESIKKLRTLVGRELADNNFASDVPRSKWSALYGALSEDLGAAAKAAGPQAEQAWTRANTFTRLASERMEQISSIVNKDAPEKIFRAATSGLSEGGTTINRLMKALPIENRREVAAAVLQRLGRAKAGQQNEAGDAFSSETFLTNLSSLSAPARRALFATSGFKGLEERITQLGRIAAIRREGSQVFANPSGTARLSGLAGWASALGTAIATGNAPGIAGALMLPVGSNVAARWITNPDRVRSLAERTTVSPGLAPAAAAAAGRVPQPQDNGKGAITDRGQPFQNRVLAGRIARERGGQVMPHPSGGFVVLPETAP